MNIGQYQLFASKLKNIPAALWDEILTYWNQWECASFGLGRITTYAFDVLTKIDKCDSRLISIWKPSHLTFLISSTTHFLTPSLAIPL